MGQNSLFVSSRRKVTGLEEKEVSTLEEVRVSEQDIDEIILGR